MEFNQKLIKNIPLDFNGIKFKKWLQNHIEEREYLEKLLKDYPAFKTMGNIVWCIRNSFDIQTYRCRNCGKQLSSNSMTQQHWFCSSKCAMSFKEIKDRIKGTIEKDPEFYFRRNKKIRKTSLEKYGTEFPCQSETVKNKIKEHFCEQYWMQRNVKSRQSCLEKFGTENPSQVSEIKEKKKITYLKKFGVDSPAKSEQVKIKAKQTCIQKFGADNPQKNPDIKIKTGMTCMEKYECGCMLQTDWGRAERIKESNRVSYENHIARYKDFVIPMFSEEDWKGSFQSGISYRWKCRNCGKKFIQEIKPTRFNREIYDLPRCPVCWPVHGIHSSAGQQRLLKFCQRYFSSAHKATFNQVIKNM